MKLIRLIAKDLGADNPRDVWINPEHVEMLRDVSDEEEERTFIGMISGAKLFVALRARIVSGLLKEASNR
jgi:uncharacterized protein YlzI (FlbEa/FlbD family)